MSPPTCLVLRALGLGDLLTAVPALRGLRRGLPDHRLVLAAPAVIGGYAVAEGLVDATVAMRPWQVPEVGAVDVAVDLHGCGPESHRVLQALSPGRLVAFGNAEAGHEGPPWDPDEPEVGRWCRLLSAYALPCDPTDLRLRPDPVGGRRPYAVVHPGAASESRRWPAERFAAAVAHLADCGLEVVVSAGPDEVALAEAVAGVRGRVATYGLGQLTDLLAGARLLVVGDTGVGHLGTACGTPSVRLFGPVDPAEWGPSIDPARHRVLWHGPHRGDPHGDALDPALDAITVDEVLGEVGAVLGPSAATAG